MRIALASMVKGLVSLSAKVAEKHTYEEAVRSLNHLQSNAAVLEKIRSERDAKKGENIPEMLSFLQRVGLQLTDVNRLNVIHVTGTKGKGSTCAFCESILRAHGYKTGFYSSPHLVEVRERIRIDGKPISTDMFSSYYWHCYDRLLQGAGGNVAALPSYFRFLTVMAFKVFVSEGVDVAIVEVGIGGRYDSTNFVSEPVVCGVTSLGLDHVSILGNSVEKIAWQKGGIFKPNAIAITVPNQPGDSESVLRACAADVGVPLHIAPSLDDYAIESSALTMTSSGGVRAALALQGRVQLTNAALAVRMCRGWLDAAAARRPLSQSASASEAWPHIANGASLTPRFLEGLRGCIWLGRNYTVRRGRITYYLDGAHTVESVQQCVEWFTECSALEASDVSGKCLRVLVFNSTGDRCVRDLLEPLSRLSFGAAVFCPNLVTSFGNSADMTDRKMVLDYQLTKTAENRNMWVVLTRERLSTKHFAEHGGLALSKATADVSDSSYGSGIEEELLGRSSSLERSGGDVHSSSLMFPCILKALCWISTGRDEGLPFADDDLKMPSFPPEYAAAEHVQVLVTGSLHLVGGVLAALQHQVV